MSRHVSFQDCRKADGQERLTRVEMGPLARKGPVRPETVIQLTS